MPSSQETLELRRVLWSWPLPSKFARNFIQKKLALFGVGSISITLPDGHTVRHNGAIDGPAAELVITHWRVLWRLFSEGDLGLARSYIEGDCHTPDLKALISFGAANESGLAIATPNSFVGRALDQFRHWCRSNTRRGSRKNITAHYDLGNDFYSHWLDHGMNYSSALFTPETTSLEQAQAAKLDKIVDLLEVKDGQRVLEIGSGWGALAERLAQRPLAGIVGLTLSSEQQRYANDRLRDRSHSAKAEIRLQDYRDIAEQFDRIVSIEMIEAVGERYWPVYFDQLRRSLAPEGVVVIQAITIAGERFQAYRRQPDFIQRYIFPGGMLPTREHLEKHAKDSGFQVVGYETFGSSYAATIAEWRRRFLKSWPLIESLGFDSCFKRQWEYYLAYCEVAFETKATDVVFLKLRQDEGAAPRFSTRQD